MQKRLAVIGTTVAAVAATTLATADSYNGCAYPRVYSFSGGVRLS
ncbi:hypothetical protein WB401_24720 [Streptomyces brasiliscabiei]|uniref:Uncharacterized protein n=1 Tax=Streptomyces brasiliscabiei TaxID=2736302 RepID=A0ABU8GFD9_9ACTN